jgi:hypothetical protein
MVPLAPGVAALTVSAFDGRHALKCPLEPPDLLIIAADLPRGRLRDGGIDPVECADKLIIDPFSGSGSHSARCFTPFRRP